MQTLYDIFGRINNRVLGIEKTIIVVSLFGMSILVFTDVLQRTVARLQETQYGLYVIAAVAFFVINLAVQRGLKVNVIRLLGISIAIWILAFIATYAIMRVFPMGVPSAQKFALGLMMWASFTGASVAAYEKRHLVLGALKGKVDERLQPYFQLIAGLVSGTFCFYLAYLAYLQLRFEIFDWQSADGVGVFEALPIPLWTVTLVMPLALTMMGFRFLGAGMIKRETA